MSWSSLGVPVRCIKVEETVTRVGKGQLAKNIRGVPGHNMPLGNHAGKAIVEDRAPEEG